MADDLWFWKYKLTARQPLNAKSMRQDYAGALVRIGEGFACIHPWPELGDPTLQKCLDDLAGDQRRAIVKRAVRCAKEDADARFIGDPLLEEIDVPDSHATLPWQDARIVESAVNKGFKRIKLKMGKELEKETAFFIEQAGLHPGMRWCIDFNEVLDPDGVVAFLESIPDDVRQRIDFLEDPCPYSPTTWERLRKQYRIPLAVDREAVPACDAAQIMVVKPAVDEPWLLAEAAGGRGQQVIVTSYMEHPVGQVFAAWEAAKLNVQFPGIVGMCGLQTHHLFTPSDFAERLGRWSPSFQSPGGTGLGFDDLLEKLPWKRLA